MNEKRSIKSYVIRGGRLNQGRQKALNDLYDLYGLRFSEEPVDFGGSEKEVVVEIGFGVGEALITIAEKNPEKHYIGIEVFPAGVATVLREIHSRSIGNVTVVMHDAVEVVRHMLPDTSIRGFHIFFPDPWPKKKHHKRRLINDAFAALLCDKLKTGGYIYAVTDWDDYASSITAVLDRAGGLIKSEKLPEDGRPVTRYEKKGMALNHEIHEILFEKM